MHFNTRVMYTFQVHKAVLQSLAKHVRAEYDQSIPEERKHDGAGDYGEEVQPAGSTLMNEHKDDDDERGDGDSRNSILVRHRNTDHSIEAKGDGVISISQNDRKRRRKQGEQKSEDTDEENSNLEWLIQHQEGLEEKPQKYSSNVRKLIRWGHSIVSVEFPSLNQLHRRAANEVVSDRGKRRDGRTNTSNSQS